MGKKIKLLWSSDLNNSTGFGTVAYQVLPRLQATGKYDIAVLGINYHGERHGIPGIHAEPCDSTDPYGFGKFPQMVQVERPDVIFVLQDLFVVKEYVAFLKQYDKHLAQFGAQSPPLVCYFPIDGNSVPMDWRDALRYATVRIAYSEYGKSVISELMPDIADSLKMIYHGIDTSVFKPCLPEERAAKRKMYGLEDSFVVGIVNRFQPRKMVQLGIRAFALMQNGYKKCRCGNYYLSSKSVCDLNFCGEGDVVDVVQPKDDIKIYLHMNQSEHLMGGPTNTIEMGIISAGVKPDSKAVLMPGVDIYGPMSPPKQELALLYGMLDCYVATDCGEGFGLTQAEALSCGIPVIKSNSTTGPEIVGEFGHLAKSATFCTMPHDSGHFRPVVSVSSVVDCIEKVYKEWVENGRKTEPNLKQAEYARKKFAWSDKLSGFDQAIQEALAIRAQSAQQQKPVNAIKVTRV